ncbi:MAG TPA: hypothetical protein VJQ43_01315 [Thermoplasmata archaeon]|nr:hypothetical protein [Thermoplasmata archaeon]
MTSPPGLPGVDAGLLSRFRAAAEKITWRDLAGPKPTRRSRAAKGRLIRIAHLNDEEARIEERSASNEQTLVVESGPVGALVLLMRWDRVGPPSRLRTHEAGEADGFPNGAIEARWQAGVTEGEFALPLSDLVGLARYALA